MSETAELTGGQLGLAGIISNEIHRWREEHEDDPAPMTDADDEAEIWELSKHLATVLAAWGIPSEREGGGNSGSGGR